MSDLDLSNPYDPDQFPKEERKPASFRPVSHADEIAAAPPAAQSPDPTPPAPQGSESPAPPTTQDAGKGAWKAAASSVPKLRQQPATVPDPPATSGEFKGFAQDALAGRSASAIGGGWDEDAESGSDFEPPHRTSPLSAQLPLWETWLERARTIPRPVVIGIGGAVLLAAVAFSILLPHAQGSVPLARIRQHPEAFDGRQVKVRGRAGETFSVGGSYVFDLRQGRDTIVVYSRTKHPSLHQSIEATGIVSIGYLDGAPRLALFEEPQTP